MIAPGPIPGDLRPNPDWASLPLFDRKGWRRLPFNKFAENINERVEPTNASWPLQSSTTSARRTRWSCGQSRKWWCRSFCRF